MYLLNFNYYNMDMNKNLPFTELFDRELPYIDKITTDDGLEMLVNDQLKAVVSVKNQIHTLKEIVDSMLNHINNFEKSRLIYCGAGTSGRIGVQDGAELYPTFGWPKSNLILFWQVEKKLSLNQWKMLRTMKMKLKNNVKLKIFLKMIL